MHFGEYEISLGLISLSPLSTAHPKTFQRQPVRASMTLYRHFTLAMDRSLGFASSPLYHMRPIQTRFRCGSTPEGLNRHNRTNS